MKRSTLMVVILLMGSTFVLPVQAVNNYVEGNWTSWTLLTNTTYSTPSNCNNQVPTNVEVSTFGSVIVSFLGGTASIAIDGTVLQCFLVLVSSYHNADFVQSAYGTYRVSIHETGSIQEIVIFKSDVSIQSPSIAAFDPGSSGIAMDATGKFIAIIGMDSSSANERVQIYQAVGTEASGPSAGGGSLPAPCDPRLGYVCVITTTSASSTYTITTATGNFTQTVKENPLLGLIIVAIIIVIVSALAIRMTKREGGFRTPNENKVEFRRVK